MSEVFVEVFIPQKVSKKMCKLLCFNVGEKRLVFHDSLAVDFLVLILNGFLSPIYLLVKLS